MKSKNLLIVGLVLLFLGFFMGLWGMHMFTYRGNYTKFMSVTGMYSFLLCMPVFILGIVLTSIGFANKKKSPKNL